MKLLYLKKVPVSWNDEHNNLLKFVSEERKKKILAYKRDSDKLLSLYAALLTRYGIYNETKYEGRLTFARKDNHKPYCNEIRNLDFNFAHTDGAILCGITLCGKVGVDIEVVEDAPYEIMDEVFCDEEKQYINLGDGDKNQRFYEMWTAKEAFTKCIGIGLVTDIKSINMIEKMHTDNLKIFRKDNYVCSVYCENDDIFEIEEIGCEIINRIWKSEV